MKNIFIINSPYLSKKQIRDIYTLHPSGIDIEIIILYLIATVGIIVISVYYCISYYKKIHQSKSTEEKVKELYRSSKQSDNTNIIDKTDRQLLGESQRVDNKEQSGICWSEADEEKNQQKEETSSNKLKERKSNHDNKTSEINLIDDTVIVVFTDHYLYTVEDKTILDKYKNTSNNLINKTPFFIWQNNMKRTNIKEVTSQLNILPTTLNLFGINYNPNYYIGSDALSQNYKGIVFFSDYSWYDGNIYVENGVIANNKSSSQEYLDEKNYYIHYLTKKNDLALKYNVFKKST